MFAMMRASVRAFGEQLNASCICYALEKKFINFFYSESLRLSFLAYAAGASLKLDPIPYHGDPLRES